MSGPEVDEIVLLVDADLAFRRAARCILADAGYGFVEAGGAREGYETAERAEPGVILIDVGPASCGESFELVRRLAGNPKTRDIPRVLVSEIPFAAEAGAVRPEDLGARAFLRKPAQRDALVGAVRSAFGRER